MRCWQELSRVKVSHLTADALQAQDDAYIASLQPKKQVIKPQAPTPVVAPVPAAPKLSPEEEAKLDRQRRLIDMTRKVVSTHFDLLSPNTQTRSLFKHWLLHHPRLRRMSSLTYLKNSSLIPHNHSKAGNHMITLRPKRLGTSIDD
jgi:hypothetical protein